MSSDYALRAANSADADAVFQIFSQPSCRNGMSTDPFTSPAAAKFWLERLGENTDKTVVTVDGVPVAIAVLLHGPDGRRHVGLVALFVHDKFQKCGIGTALMTDLMAKAREDRQVRRLELYVDCQNTAAIALYLKFGFAIEGRHEIFAISEETCIDMYTMAKIV